MNPSIKHHIYEMISQGVKSLTDMKTHLSEFITTKFGASLPDASNRRYWPTDRDIINHMKAALAKQVKLTNNAIATSCREKLSELSELSHRVTDGKTLKSKIETSRLPKRPDRKLGVREVEKPPNRVLARSALRTRPHTPSAEDY